MIALSKIIGALLLPPGICIVAAAAGALLLKRQHRVAVSALLASTVLLLLLSLEPVSDALIIPLEDRYAPIDISGLPPSSVPNATAVSHIVVLGGGTVPISPEAGGRGTLRPDALKRTLYALELYRNFHLPVVLTGGRVLLPQEVESEAEVAARLLQDLGVSPAMLLLEDASSDTWENARYVSELIGPATILLVTSAYHMPRSLQVFESFGFTCIPAPTDYKAQRIGYDLLSFLPRMGSLINSYTALHEYLGILYYILR